MRTVATLAPTPALSPGEREERGPRRARISAKGVQSGDCNPSARTSTPRRPAVPSPGGEGQGEGERSIQSEGSTRALRTSTPRARALRQHPTWAEKLMWRWLRGRRFNGYKFRRQYPKGIYYLDFFCEEARLAVELDGLQHGYPEQQRHDTEREAFLTTRGIKVLRFWNSRLRREAEFIRTTIFNELQRRAPHPLPAYTRPGIVGGTREQRRVKAGQLAREIEVGK